MDDQYAFSNKEEARHSLCVNIDTSGEGRNVSYTWQNRGYLLHGAHLTQLTKPVND